MSPGSRPRGRWNRPATISTKPITARNAAATSSSLPSSDTISLFYLNSSRVMPGVATRHVAGQPDAGQRIAHHRDTEAQRKPKGNFSPRMNADQRRLGSGQNPVTAVIYYTATKAHNRWAL